MSYVGKTATMRVGQMNEYPLTSIATLALVILGMVLSFRVGAARATYADKQQNPEMFHSLEIYSDADFMVAFRNHQNLLEVPFSNGKSCFGIACGRRDLRLVSNYRKIY